LAVLAPRSASGTPYLISAGHAEPPRGCAASEESAVGVGGGGPSSRQQGRQVAAGSCALSWQAAARQLAHLSHRVPLPRQPLILPATVFTILTTGLARICRFPYQQVPTCVSSHNPDLSDVVDSEHTVLLSIVPSGPSASNAYHAEDMQKYVCPSAQMPTPCSGHAEACM